MLLGKLSRVKVWSDVKSDDNRIGGFGKKYVGFSDLTDSFMNNINLCFGSSELMQ